MACLKRDPRAAKLYPDAVRLVVGIGPHSDRAENTGSRAVLGHHVSDETTPFILAAFPSDYLIYIDVGNT